MKIWQTTAFGLALAYSMPSFATEFSFDRPGTGFGTGITPVGHVAWEQSLPTVSYNKASTDNGFEKTTTIQGDMLFRTGLAKDLELQVGWDGPAWTQIKNPTQKVEDHGLGDVSVAVKKAVDLQDDQMSMALLAKATFATGNQNFTADHNIYTVGSTVDYQQNDLISTSISMFYEVQHGDWSVTAVPTINYKLSDKWSGYSEFVYRKKESQSDQTSLATGLIYALNARTQLDASVGVGLAGDTPDYFGGLGVAFLF
ncbi:transporter [Acinetobacter sp. MD2(2019)]|uniref:transporter n=1 Tax=Acinetobacter sp. MD2(2019) TaxID=2605273 RepID=UPI002D1F36D3|nr:transporter [Acinetobacter sp. MD2(2019)]MEB3753135.1 transporter [Acinetobacter sp. MD2(2019)]